jgi:hypothetical protein
MGSARPGKWSRFGFDGNDNVLSIFPTNRTSAVLQINGTSGFYYYQKPLGGSAAESIAVGASTTTQQSACLVPLVRDSTNRRLMGERGQFTARTPIMGVRREHD